MPFAPRASFSIPLPARSPLLLGERPLVMGILNLTPDSFADRAPITPEQALDVALAMESEGADLIDVGGESTRPGAATVSVEEERRRVIGAIERIAARISIPISVDTYKAAIAREAVAAGASIVNDVSGLLYDPEMAASVAGVGAGLVLMHTRGRSRAMYAEAQYRDVVAEVGAELRLALARASEGGVHPDAVILDPGIGFAKRPEHSYGVLAGLPLLAAIGRPLLAGPSRKSFMAAAVGDRPAHERDWGTAGAVSAAVLNGAHIVRVHAVGEMVQVVRVAEEVRRHAPPADLERQSL